MENKEKVAGNLLTIFSATVGALMTHDLIKKMTGQQSTPLEEKMLKLHMEARDFLQNPETSSLSVEEFASKTDALLKEMELLAQEINEARSLYKSGGFYA